MSDEDFEVLVALIRNMIRYEMEMSASPSDRPRVERAYREQEEAIEHARGRLVL